ncbi:RxLR-like protein [Plasmopara halstedii]|uniref:RxLR-like protein n=1 Tax=Plasmopara halstedii TaxID=4781 RepID=A0A0P1AT81_PLAHL|nr:RxLR-like protein [Plasmopara halstedii]CEG45350.1 RxLR-like protein [Plasmopara halstedii]|eukprot:XP_024581719.1 RxLR-like protein [Plasmopara halstedii]
MQFLVFAATILGLRVTMTSAIPVNFINRCNVAIDLYNNTYTEVIVPGCNTTRHLNEGFSGMFRNGWNPQATLAEFSVSWGFLWYDIGIIPTSPRSGPGNCLSLDECKNITGGVGFNTPIRIAPNGCTVVTCLADGCSDAYQFPTDDWKTHACPDTTSNVDVTFCPEGSHAVSALTPIKPKCPRRCNSRILHSLSTLTATAMVLAHQDAWRSHPFISNCAKKPLTGFGLASAIFSVYLVVDTLNSRFSSGSKDGGAHAELDEVTGSKRK